MKLCGWIHNCLQHLAATVLTCDICELFEFQIRLQAQVNFDEI